MKLFVGVTILPAPHCKSTNIARKADSERVGRWNCHACKSSFNVLSGTVFQKTRIAIGLMVNAKKSLSSCQLARDLRVSQPAAWYMQQRIRVAMVASERELLQGIVEMDETYLGGKPRKGNKREDDKPAKKGRGTSKQAVVGAVERGGRVFASTSTSLSGTAAAALHQGQYRP